MAKAQKEELDIENGRLNHVIKELKLSLVKDAQDWEQERAQLVSQLESVSRQTICKQTTVMVRVRRPAAASSSSFVRPSQTERLEYLESALS